MAKTNLVFFDSFALLYKLWYEKRVVLLLFKKGVVYEVTTYENRLYGCLAHQRTCSD